MTSIGLVYGTPVTIENCEDTWADASGGDVTCSADTTSGNYVVGSGSAKFIVSGSAGVEILATEESISANLSGCTYAAWWFKCDVALAAGDMQLLLDEDANCASPSETLNFPACVANQWTRAIVAFAGTTAARDTIISVGVKQAVDKGSLNLWIDDVVGYPSYQAFTVYAVRGLDDPADDIEYWPQYNIQHLDGSMKEKFEGFRRIISIDMGPLVTKSDRLFMHNWLKSTTKRVLGTYDDTAVSLADPTKFSNTWVNGVSTFRSFSLVLKEKDIRTTNPYSWSYTT